MVTYQVAHSTAEPFANGLTSCDPGDVMTGTGFLSASEAPADAPRWGEDLVEGSAWLAETPHAARIVSEADIILGPLSGYVVCVDMPPFHDA